MVTRIFAALAVLALMTSSFISGRSHFADMANAQSVPATGEDAAQAIRDYYHWISDKNFQTAFDIWEKREDGNAVNGQSFEKFENGFGDTATVSMEIGKPGEIEGAAGSNYIDIPVVISATTKSGQAQKFSGTYTMRSSNIADDKSWHIYSSKVKKVK